MPAFIKKKWLPFFMTRPFVLICCLSLVYAYGCARVKISSIPDQGKGSYEPKEYPSTGIPSKPYKIAGKWYKPVRNAKGFKQSGVASWYGKKFHGKKTANGEVYDMYKISAAHKTLPFGTWVIVHNHENNKKIKVRINDRGPFVEGRIIDLSYAAAKAIGIAGPGTARVHIVALSPAVKKADIQKTSILPNEPLDVSMGCFSIQVGAFSDLNQAKILKNRLDTSYNNAFITVFKQGKNNFYRVRVGIYSTLEQAQRFESILRQNGFNDVFTVLN